MSDVSVGWRGRGVASMARYGVEVCEMQEQPRASETTSDAVDEQLPQAAAAAPSIEMADEAKQYRALAATDV